MTESACTPGQTVGPFLDLGLPSDSNVVGAGHPQVVRLHGTVYDGAGDGVPDALVELWQPDGAGHISRRPGSLRRDAVSIASAAQAPGAGGTSRLRGTGRHHRDEAVFTGWGRSATDAAGHYGFSTVAPGSASAGRPPFFAITVFARGLLTRLFTRAYLPDGDLEADPLLATVDAARRSTLVCVAESGYRFDIHLQGPRETVFLAYREGGR